MYMDDVSLKYVVIQAQMRVKPLPWYDTLMFLKENLIHKPGSENAVFDRESFKD